jgi:hypothetical protein
VRIEEKKYFFIAEKEEEIHILALNGKGDNVIQ